MQAAQQSAYLRKYLAKRLSAVRRSLASATTEVEDLRRRSTGDELVMAHYRNALDRLKEAERAIEWAIQSAELAEHI